MHWLCAQAAPLWVWAWVHTQWGGITSDIVDV